MTDLYSHYNASSMLFGISLKLEIDPKRDIIKTAKINNAQEAYQNDLDFFLTLIEGKSLDEARALKRLDFKEEKNHFIKVLPLAMSLLNKAIDSYLGEDVYLKGKSDVLCLCYNVGKSSLVEMTLSDVNFDLTKLIKDTLATTACGSCLSPIKEYIAQIQSENGLIQGLKNTRTRLDKSGHWIKINGLYPADLLIKLDDLKEEWITQNEIPNFALEILNIEGNHLDVKMNVTDEFKQKIFLDALRDYYKEKTGTLFFLHLL